MDESLTQTMREGTDFLLSPRRLMLGGHPRARSLEVYYRAKDSLPKRDWIAAIALLVRNLGILDDLFHRLYGRLSGRPAYFLAIHRMALRSRRRMSSGGPDAGRHGS